MVLDADFILAQVCTEPPGIALVTVPPRMPRQDTLAYQNKSVETEKVIRMQWVEALIPAHYLLTHHDRNVLPSQLNLVDGSEVWKKQGAAL